MQAYTLVCLTVALFSLCAGSRGTEKVEIHWYAPFLSRGGYASEAMSFALTIQEMANRSVSLRLFHHGDTPDLQHYNGLSAKEKAMLDEHMHHLPPDLTEASTLRLVICHSEPGAWHAPYPRYHTLECPKSLTTQERQVGLIQVNIGRTMFETDTLPAGWNDRLNFMDEIWMPTAFMRDIFVQGGVAEEKLQVIGEPIDTELYSPKLLTGLVEVQSHLGSELRFYLENDYTIFLFVGKWEERKGIRLLVKSFLESFVKMEKAALVLLTNAYHSSDDFERQLGDMVRELGLSEQHSLQQLLSTPSRGQEEVEEQRGILLLTSIPQEDMPWLYSAASALVIPSRGEGWGRPHVESMAVSTPIIATNWSGPTEYLTEQNGFPLAIEKTLVSASSSGWHGHHWAAPDQQDLRRLLRLVHRDRKGVEMQEKKQRARQDMIDRFSIQSMAVQMEAAIDRLLVKTGLWATKEGHQEL